MIISLHLHLSWKRVVWFYWLEVLSGNDLCVETCYEVVAVFFMDSWNM